LQSQELRRKATKFQKIAEKSKKPNRGNAESLPFLYLHAAQETRGFQGFSLDPEGGAAAKIELLTLTLIATS
jgi:hypothetical protein